MEGLDSTSLKTTKSSSHDWVSSSRIWRHLPATSCHTDNTEPTARHWLECLQRWGWQAWGHWSSTLQVVKDSPRVGVAPLLLFVAVVALGVWAVEAGSAIAVRTSKSNVIFALEGAGLFLHERMAMATFPNVAMQLFVLQENNVPTLLGPNSTRYYKLAEDVFTSLRISSVVKSIVLAPAGVVVAGYPAEVNTGALGLNLLCDARCGEYPSYNTSRYRNRRGETLATIARAPMQTLAGPYVLTQGGVGAIARIPIFLEYPPGETADTIYNSSLFDFRPTPPAPFDCPSCTNASHYLWGLSTVILDWPLVLNDSHLDDLSSLQGYLYRLTRPEPSAPDNSYYLAGSQTPLADPVVVVFEIFGADWTLEGEPLGGWVPSWRAPLLATVVLLAAAAALLLLAMLKAQRQHYSLLRKMLPKNVIDRLQRPGGHYVESFGSVTVLFSDIVSYTALAAAMEPREIVVLLNTVYSIYDKICLEEGVYKVETIGDGFMAVGGAPVACPDVEAAERIAQVALRMMKETSRLTLKQKISVRIGLHCGPAVAAVIGETMPHYSLFGDTVNTASRMEATSLPGFVHVSEAVHDLLLRSPLGTWDMQLRGKVHIKGKGLMRTYFLHGFEPAAANGAPASHDAVRLHLRSASASGRLQVHGLQGLEVQAAPTWQQLPAPQQLQPLQQQPPLLQQLQQPPQPRFPAREVALQPTQEEVVQEVSLQLQALRCQQQWQEAPEGGQRQAHVRSVSSPALLAAEQPQPANVHQQQQHQPWQRHYTHAQQGLQRPLLHADNHVAQLPALQPLPPARQASPPSAPKCPSMPPRLHWPQQRQLQLPVQQQPPQQQQQSKWPGAWAGSFVQLSMPTAAGQLLTRRRGASMPPQAPRLESLHLGTRERYVHMVDGAACADCDSGLPRSSCTSDNGQAGSGAGTASAGTTVDEGSGGRASSGSHILEDAGAGGGACGSEAAIGVALSGDHPLG